MKQMALFLLFLLTSIGVFGQTTYTGFIDKYPIELVMNDVYSNGDARAIYSYTNFDEPISIIGELKNVELILFEKGKNKQNTASLIFDNFNVKSNALEGIWTDLKTQKQLKITLTKSFDVDSIATVDREILQAVSSGNKYFKVVISKDKEASYEGVIGVKIFEKKTHKLLQKIAVDCQSLGLNSISIGDYNFDGILDFSIFESSYAGPNTSSLYFLYNPKTGNYIESGFTGVSLEFDSKRKRIIERNQCCAGSSVTTAEYKVVNNAMILVNEHCYKWSEKKQSLVERKIKDCQ